MNRERICQLIKEIWSLRPTTSDLDCREWFIRAWKLQSVVSKDITALKWSLLIKLLIREGGFSETEVSEITGETYVEGDIFLPRSKFLPPPLHIEDIYEGRTEPYREPQLAYAPGIGYFELRHLLCLTSSRGLEPDLNEHLFEIFKQEINKKDQEIQRIQAAHEAFLDTQLDFHKQAKPELWREFEASNPSSLDVGNLLNFLETKWKVTKEELVNKNRDLKNSWKRFLTNQIQLIKGVIE